MLAGMHKSYQAIWPNFLRKIRLGPTSDVLQSVIVKLPTGEIMNAQNFDFGLKFSHYGGFEPQILHFWMTVFNKNFLAPKNLGTVDRPGHDGA